MTLPGQVYLLDLPLHAQCNNGSTAGMLLVLYTNIDHVHVDATQGYLVLLSP